MLIIKSECFVVNFSRELSFRNNLKWRCSNDFYVYC
jgi:hypothetical protein